MRPFRKYKLLEYWHPPQLYSFNQYYSYYTVKLLMVTWWGLRKRVITTKIRVPYSVNGKEWFEPKVGKWDYEIPKTVK